MTQVRIAKKTASGLSLDVDLAIGGGVTALYGPSGAGKSLLLDTIAGFTLPEAGRILLNDAILFDAEAGVNVPARRRGIGYVFQKLALFPHMTCGGNLSFAARSWPRLERHRRVAEMIERFDLAPAANIRPGQAGAGERLRCAVARAVIGEPKLLLIDDAGVDEPLLFRIREVLPSPIVMVTRDLDLCTAAAAELIMMEAGRVVQRGTPAALVDGPESVEAARLLGIPNLFEATIAALDPGRNSSRLEFAGFTLSGPYIRGHFRGDRIWVAVRPDALRVHAAREPAGDNSVPAVLARVSQRMRYVRLEFAGGIFADISHEEYARHKDEPRWQVEFPAASLRVLS